MVFRWDQKKNGCGGSPHNPVRSLAFVISYEIRRKWSNRYSNFPQLRKKRPNMPTSGRRTLSTIHCILLLKKICEKNVRFFIAFSEYYILLKSPKFIRNLIKGNPGGKQVKDKFSVTKYRNRGEKNKSTETALNYVKWMGFFH